MYYLLRLLLYQLILHMVNDGKYNKYQLDVILSFDFNPKLLKCVLFKVLRVIKNHFKTVTIIRNAIVSVYGLNKNMFTDCD